MCRAGDFSDQEKSLLTDLGVTQLVRYVKITDDDDLVALYKHASCFVFPSLYEGFGIPVLEAFSCNCPVLLANASCFPEIAGDAALYFDPNDPESLVSQLSRILHDKELANKLREAGAERNKIYSWSNTVKKTSSDL